MTDIRCGTCRLWEPSRNPATGRPRPTEPGACGWLPPVWPALPASYHRLQFVGRQWAPDWPTKRGMWANDGNACGMWQPKQAPKRKAQQGSLIVAAPGGA